MEFLVGIGGAQVVVNFVIQKFGGLFIRAINELFGRNNAAKSDNNRFFFGTRADFLKAEPQLVDSKKRDVVREIFCYFYEAYGSIRIFPEPERREKGLGSSVDFQKQVFLYFMPGIL